MHCSRSFVVMAVVGPALAACTTPMFTMPPGPEPYRVGYYEGCNAGYDYAGSPFAAPTAPAANANVDPWYQSGFTEGFERCKNNYQHMQKTINSVLGPPLGSPI